MVQTGSDVIQIFVLTDLPFLAVRVAVDVGFDQTSVGVVDDMEGHTVVFPAILDLETRAVVIEEGSGGLTEVG